MLPSTLLLLASLALVAAGPVRRYNNNQNLRFYGRSLNSSTISSSLTTVTTSLPPLSSSSAFANVAAASASITITAPTSDSGSTFKPTGTEVGRVSAFGVDPKATTTFPTNAPSDVPLTPLSVGPEANSSAVITTAAALSTSSVVPTPSTNNVIVTFSGSAPFLSGAQASTSLLSVSLPSIATVSPAAVTPLASAVSDPTANFNASRTFTLNVEGTSLSPAPTTLTAGAEGVHISLPSTTLTAGAEGAAVSLPATTLAAPSTSSTVLATGALSISSVAPSAAVSGTSQSNVALAKAYAKYFATLAAGSPCDPSITTLACINGDLAHCGANGTYEVTACPADNTCSALPLPAGQVGVVVQCNSASAPAASLVGSTALTISEPVASSSVVANGVTVVLFTTTLTAAAPGTISTILPTAPATTAAATSRFTTVVVIPTPTEQPAAAPTVSSAPFEPMVISFPSDIPNAIPTLSQPPARIVSVTTILPSATDTTIIPVGTPGVGVNEVAHLSSSESSTVTVTATVTITATIREIVTVTAAP